MFVIWVSRIRGSSRTWSKIHTVDDARSTHTACFIPIPRDANIADKDFTHSRSVKCKLCSGAALNPVSRSHGCSDTPAYHAWAAMIARTRNVHNNRFAIYGARGISVDPHWLSYEQFLADMGARPLGASIDRIDNNGNYCKANCRWATTTQQARNKSTNRRFTRDGITLSLIEWAERCGLPYKTVHARLTNGWSFDASVSIPLRGSR